METNPSAAIRRRAYVPEAVGPLQGVRVLDLSRLVAGNIVTHVLADFGADVIKVEAPAKGDDLRAWIVGGVPSYWKVYGRNKRSLALDYRAGRGRELLLSLVRDADMLVENFVPGRLEKMGLGPIGAAGREPPPRDRAGVRLGADRSVLAQARLRHARRGDERLCGHERLPRSRTGPAAAGARRHGQRRLWRVGRDDCAA